MKTTNHITLSGVLILIITLFLSITSCKKENEILPMNTEAISAPVSEEEEESADRSGLNRRFDIIEFCGTNSFNLPNNPNYFSWAEFSSLNWQSTNGHFISQETGGYNVQLHNQGNQLAAFYNPHGSGNNQTNTFHDYLAVTASNKADAIHNYVQQHCVNQNSYGSTIKWIIINEISPSLWGGSSQNQAYRTWVVNVAKRLKNHYHHEVIICSPYQTISAHSADWTALAQYAYIGIEGYLSGAEIKAHAGPNQSLSTTSGKAAAKAWCHQQYQSFKQSYINQVGASNASKLFLIEHFAQTKAGQLTNNGTPVSWGRCGVSVSDWKTAIELRGQASGNVGFGGFISYAWWINWMGASEAQLVSFINSYKATTPY